MTDWIEWKGGDCPVPPDTRVKVRFRNGTETTGPAGWWVWMLGSLGVDIVAYRVIGSTQDAVNHPSHYTDGGIETIDYIRAKLSAEGFRSYCLGNVLKYVSRAGKKGDATEDLKKAKVYLEWAIND